MIGPWIDQALPVFTPDPVNLQHPLNQGRLAWWLPLPGLDGGKQFVDLMGLNTGTLTNLGAGYGWSKDPMRGTSALSFDATAGFVDCGPVPAVASVTNQFTMYARARFNTISTTNYYSILTKETGPSPYGWLLRASTNGTNFEFYCGTSTPVDVLGPLPPAGTWNDYVGVYNGQNAILYINGQQVGSLAQTGNLYNPAVSVKIGCGNGYAFMDGFVAEASLWSRALSAAEVADLVALGRRGYPGVLNRINLALSAPLSTPTPTPTTVTKIFDFAADAQGFVGTAGTNVTLSYDAATGNPAGALKSALATKNSSRTSYWEWSGTWQDLGVPAGATVTAVRLNSASVRCTQYTSATSAQSGPYELRDSAGTLLATLWAGRTATTVDAAWVAVAAQADQAVPAGQQATSTSIRLRFNNTLVLPNTTGAAVTVYDDQINIVITATVPTTTLLPSFFLAYF